MSVGNEVRTVSATGGEKGMKDQRFDLIPIGALTALATHYGVGARKYADNQWRKGYEWSKSYAALQRHLTAWWDGEDLDEETGSSHMAAVAWHAFTLLTFIEEHPTFDDRFKGEPASQPNGVALTPKQTAELNSALQMDFPNSPHHSDHQRKARSMTEIKSKVNIPPRRRTATLEVELSDGRTVKAAVNKGEIKIALKGSGRYGTTDAIVIPRDPADLEAVSALILAASKEIAEQDAFVESEQTARIAAEPLPTSFVMEVK